MNPYECMYIVPKDRYRALVGKPPLTNSSAPFSHTPSPISHAASPSTQASSPSSLCPVDGRDFKHPNILAHHMKEHVNGVKCNICGKVLKNMSSLRKHLRRHGPQVDAPVEVGPPAARAGLPAVRTGPPPPHAGPVGPGARPSHVAPPPQLRCSICNKKMKHKRNLTRHMKIHKSKLNFKASKWETL